MKLINKKIKNLFIGALSVFTIATVNSCSSDYFDTNPTDAVSDAEAFSTADNVMAIVNGMIRDMYYRQNSNQGQAGQSGIMIMMDALGEDLVFPSTGNGFYISTVRWQDQINENGANDLFPYQFYYALIRNANLIIQNAPRVPANTTADALTIKKATGEAYAFRAFSYYMLVQLYGKRYVAGSTNSQNGVPLRLTVDEAPMKRNTVEEVYTQINQDLDTSLTYLKGTSRAVKSHFNESVVRGLKARVALTQGNYTIAAKEAKAARTGFALMSNTAYTSGFNTLEGNAEWMWGSTIISEQTDYFGNFGAYMSRNYNSTNIRKAPKAINSALYAKFPATDIRTKNFDPTGAHTSLGLPSTYSKFPYTSQKFLAVSQSDSRCDVPFMRSAEMYLIEAEALAKSGKETASKIVFNEFAKNRNPSYAGATTTGDAYISEILLSRRLELWGEGFRFLDLKRLNADLDRTGANHNSTVVNNVMTVSNTDKRWEYLIPRQEINANPLIEQNPL